MLLQRGRLRIDRLHVQVDDVRRMLFATYVGRRLRTLDARLRGVAAANGVRRMLASHVD